MGYRFVLSNIQSNLMRTESSNRWLNAVLVLALIVALYLNFSYKDEDLQEYYKTQSLGAPAMSATGSISAR